THQRGRGMRHSDSIRAPQIIVEPSGAFHAILFSFRANQRTHASLGPDQVPMAIGKTKATLVRVERSESAWIVEQVIRFLDDPPEIFDVVASIVIGEGGVIEIRHIYRIAVEVPDGAVNIAIEAEIGMAVHVAAQDAQGLAGGGNALGADSSHLRGLLRVHGFGMILINELRMKSRLSIRHTWDVGGVDFVFHKGIGFRKRAPVAGPY